MRTEITPAIIAHSKKELVDKLDKFRSFKTVQIDIMDGKFVADKTITSSAFKTIKQKPMQRLEFHLMVKRPLQHAKKFAPYATRIIFHFEACKNSKELLDTYNFLKRYKGKDIQVGLAINPDTQVDDISFYLSIFDSILIMGVHPGRAGQLFIPKTLKKFKEIRKYDEKIILQFDGGANKDTIKKIIRAGAQRIAVGSAFEKVDNIKKAKKELLN